MKCPASPDQWTALCPDCFRWHILPKAEDGDRFKCPNSGNREPKALRLDFWGPLPSVLRDAFNSNKDEIIPMQDFNPYEASIKPDTTLIDLDSDALPHLDPPVSDSEMLTTYDAFANEIVEILHDILTPQYGKATLDSVKDDLTGALAHLMHFRRQYIDAQNGDVPIGKGDGIREDSLDFLRVLFSKSPIKV